jgi:DNA repair exonuclease SbcCD nuclease subunit
LFEVFDLIFVGHYHNKQSLNEKIHYIGSIKPLNYGEDNDKGCVVLYDDLSFEYVRASFKKFEKISIDIDNLTQKDIKKLAEQYKNTVDNVRIEFKGDASKLKALDFTELDNLGIDIKNKQKELIEGVNLAEHNEVISFDKEALLIEFDDFCVINNIEESGKKYGLEKLNIILNEKK